MDRVITLLQSLLSLNKVASVSLPGVLSAIAISILLWPARPIDEIPCVIISGQAGQANLPRCRPIANEGRTRVCRFGTLCLPRPPWFDRQATEGAQLILDREKQNIAECVEKETSLKGSEKTHIDYLTQDIANLQKPLTAVLESYTSYEKTNSALAGPFRAKFDSLQKEIDGKRASILELEQSIRDRERNLAELARFDKTISDRLADPGRLRPRKTFDDVLIALVNHVTGFILLAIVLGVVATPIAQAGSSGFFDSIFPEGY